MVAIIVLEDSAARAVSTGLVLGAVEAEGAAAFFRKPVGTGTDRGAGAVADVAAAVAAVLVVVAPMTCAAACAAAVVAAIGSGTELPAEAAAAAVATANATGEGAVVVFVVVVAGAVVVVVATDRFLLLAASESATSAMRSMLSDLILAFTSFFFFLAGVSEAGDGAAGDDDDDDDVDDDDDEGAFRLLPPVMKAPSTPARASADSSIGDLDVDVTADDAVGMVSIIWCSIIFARISKFIERGREVDLANLLTRDLLLFYEEIENSPAGFSVLSCFFERELLLGFSWTTHELSQFLDGAIHRERHGFYCWVVSYTVLGGSRRCFHLGI
mmetsp:Transcript_30729/g.66440  ORF Transcript_30729/g.66440 Transcript_30729/m.66440 type:complete len:328 (+) Transcript_30729:215-1198(+)